VPILEDDPYGELRYEGEHVPSIVTSTQLRDGRRARRGVISTFATLSRACDSAGSSRRRGDPWLVMAKQGTDPHGTFTQMVARSPRGFDEHIKLIRSTYRVRRDAMLSAMDRHFPEGVTWTRPRRSSWSRFPRPVGHRRAQGGDREGCSAGRSSSRRHRTEHGAAPSYRAPT
jgi:2-aminoadipate transaminase